MLQRVRSPDGSPTSLCFFLLRSDIESTCYRRRSCEDCLQVPGCMLNQFGECVDQRQDGYKSSLDFLLAQERNLTVVPGENQSVSPEQAWHFPAIKATYCASTDATCSAWAATQRLQSNETIDSRYCVGASHCVVISICEANRAQVQETCIPPGGWSGSKGMGLSSSMLCAVPLVVVLALILCLGWRIFLRRRLVAAAASTQPPRVQRRQDLEATEEIVTLSALNPAGWHGQQVERVELCGAADVSVVIEDEHSDGRSYVRVDDHEETVVSMTTAATAPSAAAASQYILLVKKFSPRSHHKLNCSPLAPFFSSRLYDAAHRSALTANTVKQWEDRVSTGRRPSCDVRAPRAAVEATAPCSQQRLWQQQ